MRSPFHPQIPGVPQALVYERDEAGRLIRLSANGRVYVEDRAGQRTFDGGMVVISEARLPGSALRSVRAGGRAWVEEYRWDQRGRPVRVDGTDVERDEQGRVTACVSPLGAWRYGYEGEHLARIEGPFGIRHLTRDAEGRPTLVRESGGACALAYDAGGRRRDIPGPPANWQRDSLGRLWAITRPDGSVAASFLWDGFACLGRIDGPLGDPLAAVFSLDPSCTPVRIITRDGVTRIPRDAFGESLLAHPGVPGLHGGAIHAGHVYMRARALDPRAGAFDAPDPWHGQRDDPRRAEGYPGPLLAEITAAGPYTVCQNDPIGRVDPTGEMSAWLWISDFSWSLQNNLVGWLGMDWGINLWVSLIGGIFDGELLRRFGSSTGLKARHSSIVGRRRDGLFARDGNVWTLQHLVWAPEKEFSELAVAHVFVPGESDLAKIQRLSLYGTLLLFEPKQGDPFVMRGSGAIGLPGHFRAGGWTQHGGKAEAVYPGALTPHFPAGGIHFDTHQHDIPAPQECALTELEADGTVVRGTIDRQAVVKVPGVTLNVTAGELFLIVDSANTALIGEVARASEKDGATRVRLKGDGVATLAGRVRLRGLGAPAALPAPINAGPELNHLRAPGPAPAFAPGDALRLSQGAPPAVAGVAVVKGLAAQLELHEALPNDLPERAAVALLDPVGAEQTARLTADAKVLNLKPDPAKPIANPPAKGHAILVSKGAASIPVVVAEVRADGMARVDPEVGSLGADGDEVKWRALSKVKEVGTAAKTVAGSKVVYTPVASGSAPAAGILLIGAGDRQHARAVKQVDFDVLVLEQPLPGNSANPYSAEHLAARKTKANGDKLAVEGVRVFSTSAASKAKISAAARAIMLHELSAATPLPIASTPFSAAPFAGNTLTIPGASIAAPPPRAPTPAQLVQLTGGGSSVLAVVSKLQLAITLDRPLPAEAPATGLELVLLGPGGPAYVAEALDPATALLQPQVNVAGVLQETQMPRFRPGELVEATWTGAPAAPQIFRIATVEPQSPIVKLEAGAGALPSPSPAGLTVRRLAPIDPRNGSSRAGREGKIDAANRQKLTFEVWIPAALRAGASVAIIDRRAGKTFPAVIASVDTLTIAVRPEQPLAAPQVDLELPQVFSADYAAALVREGDDLVIPASLLGAAGGAAPVVVVPYGPSARKLDGQLSPGTVKPPDRLAHEFDLDRHQSLTEHELHHTRQSAELGPLLLAFIPTFAIEFFLERAEEQERQQFEGAWRTFFEIAELCTIGGLLNIVVGSFYAGLLWLAALGVHGLNSLLKDSAEEKGFLDFADIFDLDFFPASVPDPARPNVIRVGQRNGQSLTLAANDRVQVKESGSDMPLTFFTNRYTVTQVNADGSVELALGSNTLPVKGDDRAFEIARASAAAEEPLGGIDTIVERGLGMGWLSILFDPYGQLDYRAAPKPGSFFDVLSRVGRYAFGSKSWSFLPPFFFGYAFWDNLRKQWFGWGGGPHLASMEKGASYQSGDTYYPVGLLRAAAPEQRQLAGRNLLVGDVALYWHTMSGGTRTDGTLVRPGRQSAPGVHLEDIPRLMPFVELPASPGPDEPNRGAETSTSIPDAAAALPDALVVKDSANPNAISLAPRSFAPADLAWVPTSAALERTCGAYVAFTRPSRKAAPPVPELRHRVTLEGAAQSGSGREANSAGLIELIHDLEVRDVSVSIGGRRVEPGQEIVLAPMQRALLEVAPNGHRRYDVMLLRARDGDVRVVQVELKEGGVTTHTELSLAAQNKQTTPEPVEVSRVYRYLPAKNAFDGGGPAQFGMHLPGDLHIPVRRFSVKIATALPVHDQPDPNAEDYVAAGKPFKPGQTAVLLVPVKLLPAAPGNPNPTVTVTYAAAPAGARLPRLAATRAAAGAAMPQASAMLKYGGEIVSIELKADDPPEEEAQVACAVMVGDAANNARLEATFKLAPHFRLTRKAGGADFKVKQGDSITLVCSDGVTRARDVTITPDTGLEVSVAGAEITIKVKADAAPGDRQVLVADDAAPTHKARRTIQVVV